MSKADHVHFALRRQIQEGLEHELRGLGREVALNGAGKHGERPPRDGEEGLVTDMHGEVEWGDPAHGHAHGIAVPVHKDHSGFGVPGRGVDACQIEVEIRIRMRLQRLPHIPHAFELVAGA